MVWRKVKSDEKTVAAALLNSTVMGYLADGRNDLAKRLLEFAVVPFSKDLNNHDRKTFVLNLAQAHKWLGNKESMEGVLQSEDWSESNDTFQLATLVLRDQFSEAKEIVKTLHKVGKMTVNEYREWPIFQQFRRDEGFQTLFQELFEEPLDATPPEANAEMAQIYLPPSGTVTS
jgi:hypothetical protein